jgi:hypothetical protein
MNTHTKKKGKQEEGRACMFVARRMRKRASIQRNRQPDKKGRNVRKRETMCETTHRKAKKKNKRDPDQCNKEKENVNKTSYFMYQKPSPSQATQTT